MQHEELNPELELLFNELQLKLNEKFVDRGYRVAIDSIMVRVESQSALRTTILETNCVKDKDGRIVCPKPKK